MLYYSAMFERRDSEWWAVWAAWWRRSVRSHSSTRYYVCFW